MNDVLAVRVVQNLAKKYRSRLRVEVPFRARKAQERRKLTPKQMVANDFVGLKLICDDNGVTSRMSRTTGRIVASPEQVLTALTRLLNKKLPLPERVAATLGDRNTAGIKGIGRAVTSVLLHIQEPNRFPVYDQRTESALRKLGIWERRPRGATPVEDYLFVAEVTRALADASGLPLSELDWVFYIIDEHGIPENSKKDRDAEGEVSSAFEGRKRLRLHRTKERSLALVAAAKARWMARDPMLRCTCCSMSFMEAYGVLGEGYIQAHHTKSIASLTQATRISINDLVPVCGNCHTMLHRMKEPDHRALRLVVRRDG